MAWIFTLIVASLSVTLPSIAAHPKPHDQHEVVHTPGNLVVSENLYGTEQAFFEIHDHIRNTIDYSVVLREAAESAVFDALDSYGRNLDELFAIVRRSIEKYRVNLVALIKERHSDMDELLVIAVEMIDTNLNEARDQPSIAEAMDQMLALREAEIGKLDRLLVRYKQDISDVVEKRIEQSLATLAYDGDIRPVFVSLLSDVRILTLTMRAQERADMAGREQKFWRLALRVTRAEKEAIDGAENI